MVIRRQEGALVDLTAAIAVHTKFADAYNQRGFIQEVIENGGRRPLRTTSERFELAGKRAPFLNSADAFRSARTEWDARLRTFTRAVGARPK